MMAKIHNFGSHLSLNHSNKASGNPRGDFKKCGYLQRQGEPPQVHLLSKTSPSERISPRFPLAPRHDLQPILKLKP